MEALSKRQWPLLKSLQESRKKTGPVVPDEIAALITSLSQQIFTLGEHLPSNVDDFSGQNAKLLSAFLRAYDIHLSTILAGLDPIDGLEVKEIEAPLTWQHLKLPPQDKLEDNLPLAVIDFRENGNFDRLSLTFDRYAMSFKRPVLSGRYQARFQPCSQDIPYRIRLRDARQINYAGFSQPYSYECDVLIKDLRTGEVTEKTLSMNHVHETWDGYRFYLAGLDPATETAAQRVQIVVNLDPAKYWLTYPGALLVTLGILLLFWMRPYQNKKN